jgi:polygalacturonase
MIGRTRLATQLKTIIFALSILLASHANADEPLTHAIQGQGAEMVQFLQAGDGAVARTSQDKMREILSVKDFGAVGDGVTDDTAAFHRTRDAAGVGGRVIVPSGIYLLGNMTTPGLTAQAQVFMSKNRGLAILAG